jgi:hypothetical protein
MIEHLLVKCAALLRKHYENFNFDQLDAIIAHEGVKVEPIPEDYLDQLQSVGGGLRSPFEAAPMMGKAGYHPYAMPPPHMMPPGFPPMGLPPGYPPVGAHYPMPFYAQPIPAMQIAPVRQQDIDIKGQDPQANDMSSDSVREF